MVQKLLFIFCLLGGICLKGIAQNTEAHRFRKFSFYFENDTFYKTDRQYSSGLRLSWVSSNAESYRDCVHLPRWSTSLIEKLPFVNRPGFRRAISISVGQNIFTPDNIKTDAFIQDDRPYAGILYWGIGFHSMSPRRMDSIELLMGIVGPHSYAEVFQEKIHRIKHWPMPRGWRFQLKDEPVVNVGYDRKWRGVQSGVGDGIGCDIIPSVAASLGNVFTGFRLGTELRWGWNLPNDFGTYPIGQNCDTNVPLAENDYSFFHRHKFGFHLFAAVNGSAVLRNIFLDGNTFRESHSVDKRNFYAHFVVGSVFIVYRFKICLTHVYQTKQFTTQKKNHSFGSITFSYFY